MLVLDTCLVVHMQDGNGQTRGSLDGTESWIFGEGVTGALQGVLVGTEIHDGKLHEGMHIGFYGGHI